MAKILQTILTLDGPLSAMRAFAHRGNVPPATYAGDPPSIGIPGLGPIVLGSVNTATPSPIGTPLALEYNGIVPIPAILCLNPYRCRTTTMDGRRWERANWSCTRLGRSTVGRMGPPGLLYILTTRKRRPIRFIRAASAAYPTLQFRVWTHYSHRLIGRYKAGCSF